MNSSQSPTAKVLFRVAEDDGSANVETLWATDLGNDHYKLENSPLFAYSVSWEDVVYAPFDKVEGHPTFRKVISKSGNRTIRLVLDPPVESGNVSDFVLKELVKLGCSYEGAYGSYVSVNVPPSIELQTVRSYLVEIGATWEHGDPTYAQLFPDVA